MNRSEVVRHVWVVVRNPYGSARDVIDGVSSQKQEVFDRVERERETKSPGSTTRWSGKKIPLKELCNSPEQLTAQGRTELATCLAKISI